MKNIVLSDGQEVQVSDGITIQLSGAAVVSEEYVEGQLEGDTIE